MTLAGNVQLHSNTTTLGRKGFEELVAAFETNNDLLVEELGSRWSEIRNYVANELDPETEEQISVAIRAKIILWLSDVPGSLRQDRGSRLPTPVLDADECQRDVMKHFWTHLTAGDLLAGEASDPWTQALASHSKSLRDSSVPISDVFVIMQVVDLSLENALLQVEAEDADAYIVLSVSPDSVELETSSKVPISLGEIASAVQQEVAIQPDLLMEILRSLFVGIRFCPDLLPSIDLDEQGDGFHLVRREAS